MLLYSLLRRYAEALRCEREFLGAIEKGNLEKSQEICQSSQTMLEICLTKSKSLCTYSLLLFSDTVYIPSHFLSRSFIQAIAFVLS